MKRSVLGLMAAMASAMSGVKSMFTPKVPYSYGTQPRRSRGGRFKNKDDLPRGYPGAKFDRKCARKMQGIRHITHAY